MSCGVRYRFSIVNVPKPAQIIAGESEQIGTPHDAVEAGPADVRRAQPDRLDPDHDKPRGRQRTKR